MFICKQMKGALSLQVDKLKKRLCFARGNLLKEKV